MNYKIAVFNGPNLNLLGTREPETYGHDTLTTIEKLCHQTGESCGATIEFFQTNHEGDLIDRIQACRGTVDAIVLNAAAWTHTSVAIRDAVTAVSLPLYEVHITNVHKRDAFRHHSFLSDVSVGVICGFGIQGYEYAIRQAVVNLNK
ncbi:type II 3-dehydroquinate dehydratase [Rahnella variigena]|uniref:type II 3-dehydroquinate dehydratase n=1 Tax=Rahnella variigena TaxID=574964 RepID=UPI00244B1B1A|nr:type II 3-dehydroquinate dehydratase [Rahnella variigena]MDH2896605.1 type II 3-dehydroquinate dehydratase [Rahnella variigena]